MIHDAKGAVADLLTREGAAKPLIDIKSSISPQQVYARDEGDSHAATIYVEDASTSVADEMPNG
jgi:hypothetical protein